MPHPFEYCAVKNFFCFNLDCRVTCYIIACETILLAFGLYTNFGVDYWPVVLFSLVNFFLHLIAGLFLLLGTLWDKEGMKICFCWLVLFGLFCEIAGLVVYLVYYKKVFLVYDALASHLGMLMVIIDSAFVILWDIYSPMVVFGNLCDDMCCVTDS